MVLQDNNLQTAEKCSLSIPQVEKPKMEGLPNDDGLVVCSMEKSVGTE